MKTGHDGHTGYAGETPDTFGPESSQERFPKEVVPKALPSK